MLSLPKLKIFITVKTLILLSYFQNKPAGNPHGLVTPDLYIANVWLI